MPRPKGRKPAIRFTVSLDPHDHAELSRLADSHDLSVAWMVRKAVAEFVERNRLSEQSELPLSRAGQDDQGHTA